MCRNILTLIFLVTLNFIANAGEKQKPNIVVSITPIASLVAMVTKDKANITILDSAGGCPNNHHAKPSDKVILENSQMVIYIDDDFDSAICSMLENYEGIKLKISDIPSINFITLENRRNYHFWLDLENAKIMQSEIAEIIIKHFPDLETDIKNNLADAKVELDLLSKLKSQYLPSLVSTILLSDSLEHFVKNISVPRLESFVVTNSSLKNVNRLKEALGSKAYRCVLLSNEQLTEPYERYGKKLITFNSENWELKKNSALAVQNIFIDEYTKMIKQLKECAIP